MHTLRLTVSLPPALQEILIAELSELAFEAFEQDAQQVHAYRPLAEWGPGPKRQVLERLEALGVGTDVQETMLEDTNWNAQWEASIQPIAVGPFLIRPSWHAVPPAYADRIDLVIDPKMSFGTGYHESTRLMLRALPDVVQPGAHVLDAGAGTGILAIAAVKLGAASAFAFDIDTWAAENVAENIARNGVEAAVTFQTGSLEVVPEGVFDLVLANINRNVLIDLLPEFARRCAPGGHVILAGLLHTDRPLMLTHLETAGLQVVREATEGAWWSVTGTPA